MPESAALSENTAATSASAEEALHNTHWLIDKRKTWRLLRRLLWYCLVLMLVAAFFFPSYADYRGRARNGAVLADLMNVREPVAERLLRKPEWWRVKWTEP